MIHQVGRTVRVTKSTLLYSHPKRTYKSVTTLLVCRWTLRREGGSYDTHLPLRGTHRNTVDTPPILRQRLLVRRKVNTEESQETRIPQTDEE